MGSKYNGLTGQEIKIIKMKLNGIKDDVIAERLGMKEYQVSDLLEQKHIKAEIAKGLDDLTDEANDLFKLYGLKATENLVDAMTNRETTGVNLKAIEIILKKLGILDNKTVTENINTNINTSPESFSPESIEQLKEIWRQSRKQDDK